MKYFSLVWAGLRRRPIRLLFTMLSIATAFVLFGMLEGLNAGFALAFIFVARLMARRAPRPSGAIRTPYPTMTHVTQGID